MSRKLLAPAVVALGALLASSAFATNTRPVDAAVKAGALPPLASGDVFVPTGKGLPMMKRQATDEGDSARAEKAQGPAKKGRSPKGAGISYHGGPVMLGTVNVYYIWYGDWSGSGASGILTDLIGGLNGSAYERINTTYSNRSRQRVSGQLRYAGAYATPAYLGTAMSDAAVEQVVADAIQSGHLPRDVNGVYFVLGAADVAETSGFCSQYCGWHTSDHVAGADIKFAFVGNPTRCPSSCEADSIGPNGDAAADAMASIIAHESEEAISDPDLDAWYDMRGNENADKCAWTYGSEARAANGARYNVTLAGRHYLIQRNWVNAAGGYCAMGY